MCTIHDIFGYRIPHVDVDKNDVWRLYKYLSSELPELLGTRVPVNILERVPTTTRFQITR